MAVNDLPQIVIASGNAHKIAELRAMVRVRGLPFKVVPAADFGSPPEIVEDRETFVGNALLKVQGIARWLTAQALGDTLVLADDSGLCVDVLAGGPGVRSARFAGPAADDAANNEKLVRELRARGLTESPAHYVCALVIARVHGGPLDVRDAQRGADGVVSFEGRWHGTARIERRGAGGFGYDPHVWLQWPGEGARTVAELTREEKANESHRGQAMHALMTALVAGFGRSSG